MFKEEQGKGKGRMNVGCQRSVTDPERTWGIQGIESWQEERKNSNNETLKQSI